MIFIIAVFLCHSCLLRTSCSFFESLFLPVPILLYTKHHAEDQKDFRAYQGCKLFLTFLNEFQIKYFVVY